MPYFEHSGAKLYYEENGSGETLVFLHGASWDLRQWAHQVAHFAGRYRVIAMDARAHGRSSLPSGSVSPDIFWQDTAALLEHLHIEQAILCGLSLGGHTAIQTAYHLPQKIKAIILIGAPCSNQFNLYEKICVPINQFSMKLLPMRAIAWSIALCLGSPASKAYIRDVVGSMKHDEFVRVWKAATSMESRDDLPHIQCPALILIGDHDSLTARQQPYIHAHIANSKLVTIEHAGHGTNLDNPDQVEREMDVFLKELTERQKTEKM